MRARHPLSDAVGTLLPGQADTLLLRACVDSGAAGRAALQAWFSQRADPVASLTHAPRRWLLPLVLRACDHHRIVAPRTLATVMRSAALREELRTGSFRAIHGRMLRTLASSDVQPIVLKGAALGELVYPDPSLRHTHDIELLVHRDQWRRLSEPLSALGFAGVERILTGPRVELTHRSGLPLVLLRRPFRVPFHNLPDDDALWTRSEPATLAGAPARVLCPADALLLACGHGLHSPSRNSHRWAVDAAFLLAQRSDLDWDAVARDARARHLDLTVPVALDYLAEALAATIPRTVRDELAIGSPRNRSVGSQLALHAARTAAGGIYPLLQRTGTLRGRAAVLHHLLLPSVAFLGWATQPQSPRMRRLHHWVFRGAGYVARRLDGAVSRRARGGRRAVRP